MIVFDFYFSIVGHTEFINFCYFLNLKCNVSSRCILSGVLLTEHYNEIRQKIEAYLKNTEYVNAINYASEIRKVNLILEV